MDNPWFNMKTRLTYVIAFLWRFEHIFEHIFCRWFCSATTRSEEKKLTIYQRCVICQHDLHAAQAYHPLFMWSTVLFNGRYGYEF